MNENLNLVKILDGCPKGTKFYSAVYGEVTFSEIVYSGYYPIRLNYYREGETFPTTISFTKDGKSIYGYGECTLFPSKHQRDWSKFERFWDKLKVEKFDPKTLQPFDKVLVRYQRGQDWRTELFSHIDDTVNRVVCCCFWKQCIPYNENTKHLVGTNNDCPEYYKWWEE